MPRLIRIYSGLPEPHATLTARPTRHPEQHDVTLAAALRNSALVKELTERVVWLRDRLPHIPGVRYGGLPIAAYEIRDSEERLLGICIRPGITQMLRAGEWVALAADGRREEHRDGWFDTLQAAAEALARRPHRRLRERMAREGREESASRAAIAAFEEDAGAFAYLPATPDFGRGQ